MNQAWGELVQGKFRQVFNMKMHLAQKFRQLMIYKTLYWLGLHLLKPL